MRSPPAPFARSRLARSPGSPRCRRCSRSARRSTARSSRTTAALPLPTCSRTTRRTCPARRCTSTPAITRWGCRLKPPRAGDRRHRRPEARCQPVSRSSMRSKNGHHPEPARPYSSARISLSCSNRISVRPVARSTSRTTIRLVTVGPARQSPEHQPLGLHHLAIDAFPGISRRAKPAASRQSQAPPGLTSIETVDSGTSPSAAPNQSANARLRQSRHTSVERRTPG